MNQIVVSLFTLVFVSTANAAVYFTPSLFYTKQERKQGATSESELSIYNFKLGATLANNFYIGGVYDMEEDDNDERTSYGVGIGYINNGWNFHFTYFISSEVESGANEYSGSGMNFEIGYVFSLGAWALGPTLSYRMFEYDEQNDSNLSPKLKDDRFVPYVTLQFAF